MLTAPEILNLKGQRKMTMVTCYDSWSAKIIEQSAIDMVLVGDSVGMTVYGYPDTLSVTMEMMEHHVAAVARSLKSKFIVGDMPFLSFRQGLSEGVKNAGRLMRAGAHAVKLEGAAGNLELVHHLVQSGIPVMGHLGLTPQSVHQLGGYKVQGRDARAREQLLLDADQLQQAGCFALVLECVPRQLAAEITKQLSIPTIGIGAGASVDGQVLVFQDLIGADLSFKPKFVRRFASIQNTVQEALAQYCNSVSEKSFPSGDESYD